MVTGQWSVKEIVESHSVGPLATDHRPLLFPPPLTRFAIRTYDPPYAIELLAGAFAWPVKTLKSSRMRILIRSYCRGSSYVSRPDAVIKRKRI